MGEGDRNEQDLVSLTVLGELILPPLANTNAVLQNSVMPNVEKMERSITKSEFQYMKTVQVLQVPY